MRDTQKALDAIQEELSASEDLDTVKARIKKIDRVLARGASHA